MNFPLVKVAPAPALILLAACFLLVAGCYYPTDARSGYATGPGRGAVIPTALVIVVEGEITEGEYQAKRIEIIDYLIDRGYITNEGELVGDPANADRIIRAIVSGGGYSLSVFNKGGAGGPVASLDLEDTDILYPADPYFILGFLYLSEIGPRHLPPRPPGYYPHPRPPHSGPPPGHRNYDHDRHWSRPGQPNYHDGRAGSPPDRRRRDDNRQRPEGSTQPPTPPPSTPPRKPEDRDRDHGRRRPDNQDRPSAPPAGVPPGRDRTRPGQDGRTPPATPPPQGPDRTPRGNDRPAPATPPPPPPAPAPETARPAPSQPASSDRKDSSDDKNSRRYQQN